MTDQQQSRQFRQQLLLLSGLLLLLQTMLQRYGQQHQQPSSSSGAWLLPGVGQVHCLTCLLDDKQHTVHATDRARHRLSCPVHHCCGDAHTAREQRPSQ